jgi:hypothetical protein
MDVLRRSLLACLGLLWTASVLGQSFIVLTPVQFLDANAGCFSIRCFMNLDALNGATAVTTNTGGGVAVHVRGALQTWTVQQVLTNPDYPRPPSFLPNVPEQRFGGAAVAGDSILVAGTSPRYNMKDVVYVFHRGAGRWSHVQTLTLQRPEEYDRTRIHSITMRGDLAIVSGARVQDANETGYVQYDIYKRNADGTYSRRGGFKPPIDLLDAWLARTAIAGNIIAISAPSAQNDSGRVYIYENGAGGWQYRRALAAPNPTAGARFGHSIALDGNVLAVAEVDRADVRPEHKGAVHLYERQTTWARIQTLIGPIDPRLDGYAFGAHVALYGNRLLVGKGTTEFTESVPSFGYLFERRETQWLPVAELTSGNDDFNTGMRLWGNIAVVSASDNAYSRPGYVFELPSLGSLPALQLPETE